MMWDRNLCYFKKFSANITIVQDGMDMSWCKQPDVGLPQPDLVCFLDVSEVTDIILPRDSYFF